MKIYQIHDVFGEWEDRVDNIVASYVSKEKAKEKLFDLKSHENDLQQFSMRCAACNRVNSNGEISCGNICSHYDNHYYRIEEVEVIE